MEPKKRGFLRAFFHFITGAVVGGAIGSILGLTLAPKPGKEMREYLKDRSKDFYDKGRSLFGHPKEQRVGFIKRIVIKALMPKKKDKNGTL